MPAGDTSLGGPPRGFPDTTWGMVSSLQNSSSPMGLERLCQRYWKPVYRTIRITWRKSNEDAKDLTQAFFLWITEEEVLKRYVSERGSFRTFLKVLLGRFVDHQERALQRLKRGGGIKIIAIEDDEASFPGGLRDAKDSKDVFDREWSVAVVRQAVERARERLTARGRANQMRAFEEYDLKAPEERPTQAALAADLGVKEGDIENYLAAVRREVREEIRTVLLETTRNGGEFEEEWNVLFGD